jgi:acyl carrier protein
MKMSLNEIYEKLTEIFCDVFDEQGIVLTEATTADDIEGWDSLSHITLISEVEDCFGCTFSMKDLMEMKSVGEMVKRIEESR